MGWFLSKFVKRQTKASRFSHWEISDEALLRLVVENWEKRKPGYRDGVVLVPVPPEGFFTSTVVLKPGDRLRGGYEPRIEGEEPRKFVCLDTTKGIEVQAWEAVSHPKPPAVAVDIVLYRKDVLDEDGDWNPVGEPAESGDLEGDWLVISVNAHPSIETEVPIEPDTLIANHFHLDGGTETHMTDSEFVAALRKSVLYWKDKTVLG